MDAKKTKPEDATVGINATLATDRATDTAEDTSITGNNYGSVVANDLKAIKPETMVIGSSTASATAGSSSSRLTRALVGALVVAVIASGAVLWLQRENSQSQDKAAATQQAVQQVIERSRTNADKLNQAGDYNAEAEEYKKILKATGEKGREAGQTMLSLASSYANAKDYDNAVKWFEKAGQADPRFELGSVHGIAQTYHIKGDKQKAIEHYRKAIAIAKAGNFEGADVSISTDEAAIRALEKQ